MIAIYIPVFRVAISYSVSFGRRWTALEHAILLEMIPDRRSAAYLAKIACVPERLIVEALVNLLRAGWIEVRMAADGAYFKATTIGARRASEEILPSVMLRRINWTSMCLDRLTGAWLRTDDLEIIHEIDLPAKSTVALPLINTFEKEDGELRNLVYVGRDESFESFEPNIRAPSVLFARINFEFGDPILPQYAPLRLREAIRREVGDLSTTRPAERTIVPTYSVGIAYDNLSAENLIIGGQAHRRMLVEALECASNFVIIHSCFLHHATLADLAPALIRAAKRGVRVELLWGLHSDPEDKDRSGRIAAARSVLESLPAGVRMLIQLSPVSSGSHAKILLFDCQNGSQFETIISSCNFLSSEFDWLEMSVRTRSLRFAKQVLSRLLAAQLQTSGSWPAVARRLEGRWRLVAGLADAVDEGGSHSLTLLVDDDHYACVTTARDESVSTVDVGSDLYGVAAETSVLVPLARSAELGSRVNVTYCRLTERLASEGRSPDIPSLACRGLNVRQVGKMHAKYLLWDESALAITSFNWLSTVVDGSRLRGNEVGVLIRGPGLRSWLAANAEMSNLGI